MTRSEKAILAKLLASNGGGRTLDIEPPTVVARMLKNGLIQPKPNQHKSGHFAFLYTLTDAGRKAAAPEAPR